MNGNPGKGVQSLMKTIKNVFHRILISYSNREKKGKFGSSINLPDIYSGMFHRLMEHLNTISCAHQ